LSADDYLASRSSERSSAVRINSLHQFFFLLSMDCFDDVAVQADDGHGEESCDKADDCVGKHGHGYRLSVCD